MYHGMIPRGDADGDPKLQGSARSGSLRWAVPERLPPDLVRIARRKLRAIDAAVAVRDLTAPPGNRLEKLKGDRVGQWSIRINDQWRVCFVWTDDGAHDVEIVDYH
jgi:toxin HigB-1